MPTAFLWKSLDVYSGVNRHLSRCPVEWSPKLQALVYHGKLKDVFWWYFNVYVLMMGLGAGSVAIICFRQAVNPKPNVTGIHLTLYLLACLAGCVAFGVALALTFHGEISVTTCNQAFVFEHNFEKPKVLSVVQNQQGRFFRSARFQADESNWRSWALHTFLNLDSLKGLLKGDADWLGMIIMSLVVVAGVTPSFVTLVCMFLNLEPWRLILEDIIPPEIWGLLITQLVYKTAATAALFVIISEGVRLFPVLFLLFVLPVVSYLDGIRSMDEYHKKCCSPRDFLNLYRLFIRLQIVNKNSFRYIPIQSFLLLAIGAILVCFLNIGSLRLYGVIPFPVYLVVIAGNVATWCIIDMILPYGINIHENSSKALTFWVSQLGPRSKYIKKKFIALRSIRFYAGFNDFTLFVYQKSVQPEYFDMILDKTINILVTIPEDALQLNRDYCYEEISVITEMLQERSYPKNES